MLKVTASRGSAGLSQAACHVGLVRRAEKPGPPGRKAKTELTIVSIGEDGKELERLCIGRGHTGLLVALENRSHFGVQC